MMYIAYLLIALLPSQPTALTQEQQVKEIYHNLQAHSGYQDWPALVFNKKSLEINAMYASAEERKGKLYYYKANEQYIMINKALVDDANNNSDQIALVLAHEMSHYRLNHIYNPKATVQDIRLREAEADQLGAYFMLKAGYNICEAVKLQEKWLAKNGNDLNGDHPDYSYRINTLKMPWCK